MINTIKNMINSKKEFTEATDLLLEGTSLASRLDDTIVLGEEASEPEIPEEDTNPNGEKKETEISDDENDTSEGSADNDGGAEPNIEDRPIEDTPAASSDDGDILNAPIDGSDNGETPMPLPGDDLPAPVGKQTGEPIEDTDILSTEIDLGSNTMKDVLPVPPGNAPEAVNDDILNQRIDDGFGGENEPGPSTEETPENPLGSPTEPIPEPTSEEGKESTEPEVEDPEFESTLFDGLDHLDESTKKEIMNRLKKGKKKDDKECKDEECKDCKECDDKIVEGYITMSDDDEPFTEEIVMSGDSGSEDKPDETSTSDGAGTEETPAEPGAEDSPVTAAVKDKVAETESPLEAEIPEGSPKDTLMKKLATMSKNMEDIKLQVSKLAQ